MIVFASKGSVCQKKSITKVIGNSTLNDIKPGAIGFLITSANTYDSKTNIYAFDEREIISVTRSDSELV